jgi:hypothetical protein
MKASECCSREERGKVKIFFSWETPQRAGEGTENEKLDNPHRPLFSAFGVARFSNN